MNFNTSSFFYNYLESKIIKILLIFLNILVIYDYNQVRKITNLSHYKTQ